LEDYERAIGRKAHPEDFADINAILGDKELPVVPTDAVAILPVKKPHKQWWKEVMDKAQAVDDE